MDLESVSTLSEAESLRSGERRRFAPALSNRPTARQARESVKQTVTHSNPLRTGPPSFPLDYENYLTRNRTAFDNDPLRELVVFPRDDLTEHLVPQEQRTVESELEGLDPQNASWHLTRLCLQLYTQSHKLLVFNYAQFSGDYNRIDNRAAEHSLSELTFELDLQEDEDLADKHVAETRVLVEGFVTQVPESSSSFLPFEQLRTYKRRYAYVKHSTVDDSLELTLHKDRRAPVLNSIAVHHFSKRSRKNRQLLEVVPVGAGAVEGRQGTATTSTASHYFVLDSDNELNQWLSTITQAQQHAKQKAKQETQSIGSNTTEGSGGDTSVASDDSHWAGRAAGIALQPNPVARKDLFQLYPDLQPLVHQQKESSLLIGRSEHEMNRQAPTVSFVVACRELNVKLPVSVELNEQIEPFFIRMCLVDGQTGERVSEEWHVSRTLTQSVLTDTNKMFQWACSSKRQALFTVCKPHKHLYVLVRVERVLQPASADVYAKPDVKATLKLHKQVHTATQRLRLHRMSFAWTAKPVFQEFLSGSHDRLPLYKCDTEKSSTEADVLKFITELSKPDKANKLACYPGAYLDVNINLSCRASDIMTRFTPRLRAVRPFAPPVQSSDQSSWPPAVIECRGFPLATGTSLDLQQQTQPHTEYVNELFVYPLLLRYDAQRTFARARNICCTVQLMHVPEGTDTAVPLECVYWRLSSGEPSQIVTSSERTLVSHHNQQPMFNEEFKLQLPIALTLRHHLLFSFTHIGINAAMSAAANQSEVEQSCGFACLPLVKGDRLLMENDVQEFALPVAAQLVGDYWNCQQMGMGKGTSQSDIKFVDNGRALFRVRLRLVSSVYTTDVKLQRFFQSCEKLNRNGLLADAIDSEPTKALQTLSADRLVPFLPAVLQQLLVLLPHAQSEQLGVAALNTLVSVVQCAYTAGHEKALRAFVRLQFNNTVTDCNPQAPVVGAGHMNKPEPVHECVCRLLPLLLRPAYADQTTSTALLRHAAFFLEIVAKSMAQHLLDAGLNKVGRLERFPCELLYRVDSLVQAMVPLFIANNQTQPTECRLANTALAYFFRMCLSFLDRGAVLKLIYYYVDKMDKAPDKIFREYKLDMLRVLSEHEHWLPLCLPLTATTNHNATDDPGLSDELYLTTQHCERHFLSGLLLHELKCSFGELHDCRRVAIAIVRNLLAKHATDTRYIDQRCKERISTLYLPLLPLVLEQVHELVLSQHNTYNKHNQHDTQSHLSTARLSQVDTLTSLNDSPRSTMRGSVLGGQSLLSAGSTIVNPSSTLTDTQQGVTNGNGHAQALEQNKALTERLSCAESRDLLLCSLAVLVNAPEEHLSLFWHQAITQQLHQWCTLFELCLQTFAYQGRRATMAKTSSKVRVSGGAVHSVRTSRTVAESDDWSVRTLTTANEHTADNDQLPFSVLQEAHLAQQVAITVLHLLAKFTHHCKDRLESTVDECEQLLLRVTKLYVSLLSESSSVDVRVHTLSALAVFVRTMQTELFHSPNGGCSNIQQQSDTARELLPVLCSCLLRQLCSRLQPVQRAAAALMQVLLRMSYEAAGRQNTLGVLGTGMSVALAHLLSSSTSVHSLHLQRGLTLLHNLAATHRHCTHFDQLVLELVVQLRDILSCTGALRDAETHPYKLCELHVRLADAFRSSAALRLAWLEALAAQHTQTNAFTEAACCHLHCAAILAKQLQIMGVYDVSWHLVGKISENVVREEKDSVHDAISADTYTVEQFCSRVEQIARLFSLADRHEALGPLYRLITPAYELRRDYASLADAYQVLHDSYRQAAILTNSDRRSLATYFRVVFYGQLFFHEEHGREWIYKMAGHMSLAEAAERLRHLAAAHIGHDRIEFIGNDVQMVSASALSDTVAYIQMAHVEPLLDTTQLDGNSCSPDQYDKHTNVKRFYFENKLKSNMGLSLEDLDDTGTEQTKRELVDVTSMGKCRIVLTASQCFPCMLLRLPVVQRGEQQYTPLAVAIEQLTVKGTQLRRTLAARPLVDCKRLQLQLQGIVQTTVNAGPLVYATAFNHPKQRQLYGDHAIQQLAEAFCELMRVCAEAIQMNAQLIGSDQIEYHKLLTISHQQMMHTLTMVFGSKAMGINVESKESAVDTKAAPVSHVFSTISAVDR